ncbi:unnamed protein product [Didymodactylos carnosus]|uniref:Uncharacterized protein n=1 Tax=Didymodactylos carnosus TaxID=1234261 RepID=A0A813VSI1_9BILA|nr:unnamed protein product [Didymodactylos carnosus]CAF0847583.1 unnamed protein product [Didymodactylos carnosus]CAF1311838.1 unnamed protein product [Didymodactylos carnosus]CAF3635131.1 unnamed protein product [Didymodactylos carnosus]CAF3635232.1 unnamed protein product [Didymodactylos carnosus]
MGAQKSTGVRESNLNPLMFHLTTLCFLILGCYWTNAYPQQYRHQQEQHPNEAEDLWEKMPITHDYFKQLYTDNEGTSLRDDVIDSSLDENLNRWHLLEKLCKFYDCPMTQHRRDIITEQDDPRHIIYQSNHDLKKRLSSLFHGIPKFGKRTFSAAFTGIPKFG